MCIIRKTAIADEIDWKVMQAYCNAALKWGVRREVTRQRQSKAALKRWEAERLGNLENELEMIQEE